MSAEACLHFRVTVLLIFLPVAVLNSYPTTSRGHSALERYVITSHKLLTDDELQCSHWNASSAKPKLYLNTCSFHCILISWNRTYILHTVTVSYCVFCIYCLIFSYWLYLQLHQYYVTLSRPEVYLNIQFVPRKRNSKSVIKTKVNAA
jgi:hypothetical protein